MLRVGSVELCAQAFGERGDPAILLDHARALASRSVPFEEAATRSMLEHALGRTADVRASLRVSGG
jgi:hypothetical protein